LALKVHYARLNSTYHPPLKPMKRKETSGLYKKVRLSWRGCFFCLLGLAVFSLFHCSRGSAERGVIVAGSTSIQPFADRWAEIYMKIHPGEVVDVQGGGSSAGIQAAREGSADIGMSSRELKQEEKDLAEIVVAWDGLAVIVHPRNRIDGLTVTELQAVFLGKIRNWKEIGGDDHLITVVSREEGSGTRGAFQEMVMKKNRISPEAIVQNSNGTVREIVSHDPNSLGYISLGLVDSSVKALKLDGIHPDYENIKKRAYKLIRPFLFVIKGAPKPGAQSFIDFVLSADGQALIKEEGLIPALEQEKERIS